MTDPDLAKVHVFMLCTYCGTEREIVVPRITLDRGRLVMKLSCASCGLRMVHRLNPLKLPAEDA